MVVGDAYVFPGFLTPVLTQLFFPKPPTTFLAYFCRDERRKYAGKKSHLNRGSNSQPPGHESDTLTTEPGGGGGGGGGGLLKSWDVELWYLVSLNLYQVCPNCAPWCNHEMWSFDIWSHWTFTKFVQIVPPGVKISPAKGFSCSNRICSSLNPFPSDRF